MIEYERLEKLIKQIIKDMVRQEDEMFVANYLYSHHFSIREIEYLMDEC